MFLPVAMLGFVQLKVNYTYFMNNNQRAAEISSGMPLNVSKVLFMTRVCYLNHPVNIWFCRQQFDIIVIIQIFITDTQSNRRNAPCPSSNTILKRRLRSTSKRSKCYYYALYSALQIVIFSSWQPTTFTCNWHSVIIYLLVVWKRLIRLSTIVVHPSVPLKTNPTRDT